MNSQWYDSNEVYCMLLMFSRSRQTSTHQLSLCRAHCSNKDALKNRLKWSSREVRRNVETRLAHHRRSCRRIRGILRHDELNYQAGGGSMIRGNNQLSISITGKFTRRAGGEPYLSLHGRSFRYGTRICEKTRTTDSIQVILAEVKRPCCVVWNYLGVFSK